MVVLESQIKNHVHAAMTGIMQGLAAAAAANVHTDAPQSVQFSFQVLVDEKTKTTSEQVNQSPEVIVRSKKPRTTSKQTQTQEAHVSKEVQVQLPTEQRTENSQLTMASRSKQSQGGSDVSVTRNATQRSESLREIPKQVSTTEAIEEESVSEQITPATTSIANARESLGYTLSFSVTVTSKLPPKTLTA
jgi:hypothetical protein